MSAIRGDLTDAKLARAAREGYYPDGRKNGLNLYLRVHTKGKPGRWLQKLTLHGKRREFHFGTWPEVSLEEARLAALLNKTEQIAGKARTAEEIVKRASGRQAPTLAEVADKLIADSRPTWKAGGRTEAAWRSALQLVPGLLATPVDQITVSQVRAELMKHWHKRNATARKLRERLAKVLDLAIGLEYRSDANPAGRALLVTLPKVRRDVRHHPALDYEQVPDAIAAVREVKAKPGMKLAFELLVLTGVRTVEAFEARWPEFDLEARLWRIPAARMKGGREHIVPLSERAVHVLEEARKLPSRGVDFVFPSMTKKHRPITSMGVKDILRKRAGFTECTLHGFRSSLRDFATEQFDASDDLKRCLLAHRAGDNSTERAYARSTMLEQRRRVLDAWGSYITGTAAL